MSRLLQNRKSSFWFISAWDLTYLEQRFIISGKEVEKMATAEERAKRLKQQFDVLVDLPNHVLRRGVAKSGSPMTGFTDYNWKLLRDEDGHFQAYVEWVDLDGDGHRVVLPNGVIQGLFRAKEAITKSSRKAGARKAVQTRKDRGIVPFVKKEA